MSELSQQLNKIASNKGTQAGGPLAIASLVVIDKNNEVVFDGDDVPGFVARLRLAGSPSGIVELEGSVNPVTVPTQASLEINLAVNNNLKFTAVPVGVQGNGISVEYRDPGEADIVASVVLEGGGKAIVIILGTDSGRDITTTANDIIALVAGSGLVTAAAISGDGSAAVSASDALFLDGGVDPTGLNSAGKGSRYTNYSTGTLWINTGSKTVPDWRMQFPSQALLVQRTTSPQAVAGRFVAGDILIAVNDGANTWQLDIAGVVDALEVGRRRIVSYVMDNTGDWQSLGQISLDAPSSDEIIFPDADPHVAGAGYWVAGILTKSNG